MYIATMTEQIMLIIVKANKVVSKYLGGVILFNWTLPGKIEKLLIILAGCISVIDLLVEILLKK